MFDFNELLQKARLEIGGNDELIDFHSASHSQMRVMAIRQ